MWPKCAWLFSLGPQGEMLKCCVCLCVQEKSRITVTGRDVAGSSPVRTSSRGITGSTRAIGRSSARNATEPSPGPTTSRCTWNDIYNQDWKTPKKWRYQWTSEPHVAFEQESVKPELRVLPQHQSRDFSCASCLFFPLFDVVFQHAGDSLSVSCTLGQYWNVHLLTDKTWRCQVPNTRLEIYEYQG